MQQRPTVEQFARKFRKLPLQANERGHEWTAVSEYISTPE